MRILLAGSLLWHFAWRWPFAVEIYSSAGDVFPASFASGAAELALPPMPTVLLYTLFLFALASLLLGWMTRTSAAIAGLLLVWFSVLDGVSTVTKYTAIAAHLLFLLTVAKSGDAWSLGQFIRRNGRVRFTSAWPRRLAQLLVCSIYAGAAVTKLRLPEYFSGDLLEFSLLDDAYGGRYLGHWLAIHPTWLIVASYLVLVFEMFFPVLIWIPRIRPWMLLLAVLFHLTLWVTMHLEIFSPVMLSALMVFLTEDDLSRIRGLLARVFPRSRRIASPIVEQPASMGRLAAGVACWSAVGGIAVTVGVFVRPQLPEYSAIDFPKIPADRAQAMIDAYAPPYSMYFHRFRIGSRLGFPHVFGDDREFRAGMVVHAMARVLTPHPELELEWRLVPPPDSEFPDAATATFTRTMAADHNYAHIGFRLLSEFPAGQYVIQLSAGEALRAKEVVAEIPFLLSP